LRLAKGIEEEVLHYMLPRLWIADRIVMISS
jgi:hypothetical protein